MHVYLLVPKEYMALPITDQETLEIAFATVTPLGYSLEVYLDDSVENHSHVSACPTHVPSTYHVGGISHIKTSPHEEVEVDYFIWMPIITMSSLRCQTAKVIVGWKMRSRFMPKRRST